MKKMISVLSLVLCLIVTGCSDDAGTTRKRRQKDDDDSNLPRTIDISDKLTDHDYLSYEFDFDFNGGEEEIEIEITSEDDDSWNSELHITIDDCEKTIPIYGNWV